MQEFKNFLRNLSFNTGVPFNLIDEKGTIIYDCGLNFKEDETLEFPLVTNKLRAKVILNEEFETCINLLKYVIQENYKQLYADRETILKNILNGEKVAQDDIDICISGLDSGYNLIYIKVDGSRYEAVDVINQLYSEEVLVVLYGDSILVIGQFEDVEEHTKSIKDSILSDLYSDCFVSYGKQFNSVSGLKKTYSNAKECYEIVGKFNLKENVFNYDNIIFEKIVYNLNDYIKDILYIKFRNKFDKFDNEVINTIEMFVDCDLNISDTAKKLYIHRNTLIYRLDKIKKDTGFDIRNFKEASVFIIGFLIWKEIN
ncbi:PucR family transcriptional regulator [Clostridium sp. DL1XJH146]